MALALSEKIDGDSMMSEFIYKGTDYLPAN